MSHDCYEIFIKCPECGEARESSEYNIVQVMPADGYKLATFSRHEPFYSVSRVIAWGVTEKGNVVPLYIDGGALLPEPEANVLYHDDEAPSADELREWAMDWARREAEEAAEKRARRVAQGVEKP